MYYINETRNKTLGVNKNSDNNSCRKNKIDFFFSKSVEELKEITKKNLPKK